MTRARDLADSADKDISGTLVLDDITLSNDISIADNGKAIFGAGSDLQIYHDGSNSYIKENGIGSLRIQGADLEISNPSEIKWLKGFNNDRVELFYNNAIKLATTSTGVDITGTLTSDGLSVDGGTIKLDGNYPVGTSNVALGDQALDDASLTGGSNTAIGGAALTSNTSGYYNTAVGHTTLQNNTTGQANTAVGYAALDFNVSGQSNTAQGFRALRVNTSGDFNTAVGVDALYSNTTASNNTAVGYRASHDNTTGTRNVSMGTDAMYQTTTGNDLVGIGYESLTRNTTGSNNVAIGKQALAYNTTANNNTAVGHQAGYNNTTGTANTFLGTQCAFSNSTGSQNTFIGQQSGETVTTGSKNTILGRFNGNQGGLDIRTSSNNIVLSDGDGNPRMYVNDGGYAKFRSESTGYYSPTGDYYEFNHNSSGSTGVIFYQQSPAFVNTTNQISNARTQSANYTFWAALSGVGSDYEFKLRGDGQAYADGSWNGGGADYAEYFEWADGNTSSQDRTGYTVVLDNEKIRLATSEDSASSIIGAISVNPSVIGDTDIDAWKQKYQKDDFGAYIKETYTLTTWEAEDGVSHSYESDKIPDDLTVPDDAVVSTEDEKGNTFERRILNPDYDPDQAYVSRENRPEWATVGLMGKLRIRKGQPTGSNWIKMRDVSDAVEEWLVR